MSNENMMVLANPAGNMEAAQALCRYVRTRKDELLKEIEAATKAVTADNYASKETATLVKMFADTVEDLRNKGKSLVKEVVAATEAQRVLTAIDSRLWSYSNKVDPDCAYAQLTTALKELKAKVAGFKDAEKSAVPTRAVALVLYATDAGLAKLADNIRAGKVSGVQGYKFAPNEATEKKAIKILETTQPSNHPTT